MTRNHLLPTDRCAEILLALLRRQANHRLSPEESNLRRAEVNKLLSRLDDRAVDDVLQRLYRLAEADARRRAGLLARALVDEQPRTWLEGLRRKISVGRRQVP